MPSRVAAEAWTVPLVFARGIPVPSQAVTPEQAWSNPTGERTQPRSADVMPVNNVAFGGDDDR